MELIDIIRDKIAAEVTRVGAEVVDVAGRRENGSLVLRILADKPGGITVEECASLNVLLGDLLDKEDGLSGPYVLEVSSPGLDRPIKTERDFERVIGARVRVTLKERIDGKFEHQGVLIGGNPEEVVIERKNGVSVVIPRASITRAVRVIECK